jgi:hypothetical protein
MSGPHLWPTTRFLLLPDICGLHVVGRPSWRENGSVIYLYNSLSLSGPSPEELMTTSYCPIRDSLNLEGQVPVFISPRNRVAQLYPRALGSNFVASYDSQGYGGGILTRLHFPVTTSRHGPPENTVHHRCVTRITQKTPFFCLSIVASLTYGDCLATTVVYSVITQQRLVVLLLS